ncbi:MAG: phage head-tail adapter protein [Bacillota bacterium]|nr:phage head-tail adapter protein [Bacillota bacterium]
MRHNQVIYLIKTTITEDEVGNQIQTPSEREVFANEFSVGASEFYNAAATGLRPAKMFEVYSFEYEGEEKLKNNSIAYRVIRVEGKGEKTRLTCEKVAADG